MLSAGYLLARSGWTAAAAMMLPSGVLISLALILVELHPSVPREIVRPRDRGRRWINAGVITLLGIPWTPGKFPVRLQALISGAVLSSGATLLLAGYGIGAWTWWSAPPLVGMAGLIIAVAFYLTWTGVNGGTDPEGSR